MNPGRFSIFAVIGAFLLAELALASTASAVPDPVYPTGTFAIKYPTEYVYDVGGWRPEWSRVTVQRLTLSDDVTPPEDIVVKVYSGTDVAHSTNGDVWNSVDPKMQMLYGGALDTDPIDTYHLAGTYHPYVTLTDGDGHTTQVDLPTVTLLNDHTPPVTKLTLPRLGKRNTIIGWRYIRGTSIDAGVDRPEIGRSPSTSVTVLQKRHGVFYYYVPKTQRWRKGLLTEAATVKKFRPDFGAIRVGRIGWRTPYIHGLTRGRLVIRAWSQDSNLNETSHAVLARYTLTRRR